MIRLSGARCPAMSLVRAVDLVHSTLSVGDTVPQQIQRFGIGQTAKVAGVLYGLMGLVFVPIFFIAAMVAPKESGFNLVAGWVGGIEVELG